MVRLFAPGIAAAALVFTVLAGGAARAGGLYDCAYIPNTADDMTTVPACATVSAAGIMHLQPGQLRHLSFDENGLAAVQVDRLFYYVARNGETAPVASVEDRAVTFHDGLAPSPRFVGGRWKIGYIDTRLRLVIPARYDGGLDFAEGGAQVCLGCKVDRDGSMAELTGGRWGCIDTHGREVVPVAQPSPDGLDCSRRGG